MFTTDPRLVALRDSLPGQVLRGSGRVQYHLRERIGEGGQGWVFTANWDEPGGFVVIVKVLRPDAVNSDTLRRFQREADVLRMLSQQGVPNPHIVRFYDHATAVIRNPNGGDPIQLPFTVLEYVNGLTLEKVLDQSIGKGIPVERVRRILRQVASALEIVHAQKVIHRDLKPSNILLAVEAGTEIAKVTDFGLVKLADVSLQRTATLAGASLGYAPPEQYEQGNRRVSERTDVFSVAAITFEMLAGKMAFPYKDGENPLLIVTRIMNGPRPSLLENPAALPAELRARPDLVSVIDTQLSRALSPDPASRQANVNDFFTSIEPVLRAAAEGGPARADGHAPSRALPFSETIPASLRTAAAARESSVPPVRVSMPNQPPQPTQGSAQLAPQPSGDAVRRDTSNPALWSWRVATPSVKADIIRSAFFTRDGSSVYAIGPSGLARWDQRSWIGIALPPGFDVRRVKGMSMLDNDLLLFGEVGLGLKLNPTTGTHAVLTTADPEAVFLGACVEPSGTITLVGERPARGQVSRTTYSDRVGAIVQYSGSRLTLLSDAPPTARLRAVAMVGGALAACGDRGALVRIENGVAEYRGALCNGDLNAIAPLPSGGAVTVGTGGHALALTPSLEAHLEAVQTTADLICVSVSDTGTAWAGAQKARIVRRTGDSWLRMSGELGVQAAATALWCGPKMVRAVCADGAVIEGQLP